VGAGNQITLLILHCISSGLVTVRKVTHAPIQVNQNVKAIFKLRGNWDREELAHCTVLAMPIEEFSHVQYSTLPSVEWQQRGQKHGPFFARLHH